MTTPTRCEHDAPVWGCRICWPAEDGWGEDEPGHVTPVGGWILVALVILAVLVAVVWRVTQ